MRNNAFLAASVVAVLCAGFSAHGANAQQADPGSPDTYVQCTFHPEAGKCEALWKSAGSDPASQSVKAAYEGYARYLGAPAATLTDEDRRYLHDNAIRVPDDLSNADVSGLHYVINDPALAKDDVARRIAVNNFLTRAVAAELYCGFNTCGA